MGRNSKKQKLSKAEARHHRTLQKEFARIKQAPNIPAAVAQSPRLPDTLSFLDGLNYQIIFESYNHRECQIAKLTDVSAKAMINKLSAITKFNSKTIRDTTIIRDKVENSGGYASLYNGLDAEIELVEVKFAEEGRIFCYLVDDHPHSEDRVSNYCCIVAVKVVHIRT